MLLMTLTELGWAWMKLLLLEQPLTGHSRILVFQLDIISDGKWNIFVPFRLSTCPGLYVFVLKTQLRVKLRYPTSMACNVITSGYLFLTILLTSRCSHNNSLKWLPECANTWVTCSVLLRSMRSAVIFTSSVSLGHFHSSICLIKVWRSVCLQISFTYFSFFCAPFVGEKGILLLSFSSKRWLIDTLLSLIFS